ncbi:pentatricopeptide repeat-containing protein At3g14580, mitochondrial [Macadamia integrifolia]|uniref:pentatricopeptide repeat-containing protein At3g14580, mitochondrial n=1 Tax=Macadamia integrifolia TaxID=60698 RepID=UPI001C52E91C|nr:pentatricopeptide repeat-containing protein At3g14580, mitochondrial [Macadamia integrifolia]
MAHRLVSRSRHKIPKSIFSLAFQVDLGIIRLSSCNFSAYYASSASIDKMKVLDRLNHKDWLAPNEVLKIFKPLRGSELVLNALERMSKRKDYKPNEALYSLVIEKLAQAKKFDAIEDVIKRIKSERDCRLSDDFFYGVIKIYGNMAGYIDKAIQTLFSMPEFNCWPEVRTFNFVLNMLVSAKQFDVIHEVYLGAPRLGVTIDACCLNILIKGLCDCDKLDSAFALLDEFPKQGCRPNVRTYSTLMHSLCEHGRVDEAFQLFERMEREGCFLDTIAFNVLISGLCKQGRVGEGMELLEKMKLKGCYPNSGSYQTVLYGLLDSEKFVEAKRFIEMMINEGLLPSFLSFKLVIQGLCKENLLEDVDLVLRHMIYQGFVPKMGLWRKIIESIYSGKNKDFCFSQVIYD